jgi:hypothetical protein
MPVGHRNPGYGVSGLPVFQEASQQQKSILPNGRRKLRAVEKRIYMPPSDLQYFNVANDCLETIQDGCAALEWNSHVTFRLGVDGDCSVEIHISSEKLNAATLRNDRISRRA